MGIGNCIRLRTAAECCPSPTLGAAARCCPSPAPGAAAADTRDKVETNNAAQAHACNRCDAGYGLWICFRAVGGDCAVVAHGW